MSGKITSVIAGLMLGMAAAAIGQQTEPDVQKVLDQYTEAWNKGDAKGLALLYTTNAVRIAADGQVIVGREDIEKSFTKNFAGVWKGTKIVLRPVHTQNAGPDVRILHGTWELSGVSSGPAKGLSLSTLVRQGGQWKLASIAAFPEPSGAK